jgi:hypothetical protein
MKLNSRVLLPILAIAAGLTFSSSRVAAQAQPLSTTPPVIAKSTAPKPLKFDGEVISFTSATIMVRSKENPMLTQTFSFSPALREQMLKIVNKGGYQYGDKVVIHYTPGTIVAVKVQGKPSKPKVFTSPNTSQK